MAQDEQQKLELQVLSQISTDLKLLATELKQTRMAVEDNRTGIKRLDDHIRGNGKPGILTRMRSLEEERDRRRYHYGVFYTAILASIVAWIGKHFGGSG